MLELSFGNFRLLLKDQLSYKWNRLNRIFTRGYIYYNGHYYTDLNFTNFINECYLKNELENIFENIDGIYSIIVISDDMLYASVDKVRSLPIFYRLTDNIEISDSVSVEDETINDLELRFYKNALFTLGNKTIFNNTYQIEAGTFVKISKSKTLIKNRYFSMKYSENQIDNELEAVDLLQKSYMETFVRLLNRNKHNRIVIPLSGGHDSRLIAFYLKCIYHKDLIAYSYGMQNNQESNISNSVANILDIPWYFVDYNDKNIKTFFKEHYKDFSLLSGNGSSVPCLQEWFAIYTLLKNGIINKDDVIIPGYSGDFMAGTHLVDTVLETTDDLLKYIVKRYVNERKHNVNDEIERKLSEFIEENFKSIINKSNNYNQIIENFDLTHRQANFIVNAVRVYDYFGLKWELPFFDDIQFMAWSNINNSLRYNRKAFFKLENIIYPDKLKVIPYASTVKKTTVTKIVNLLKNGPGYLHFIYNYFPIGFHFYMDLFTKNLRNVNMYAQDEYLKIIRGLMK